jgi:hypothetical protein
VAAAGDYDPNIFAPPSLYYRAPEKSTRARDCEATGTAYSSADNVNVNVMSPLSHVGDLTAAVDGSDSLAQKDPRRPLQDLNQSTSPALTRYDDVLNVTEPAKAATQMTDQAARRLKHALEASQRETVALQMAMQSESFRTMLASSLPITASMLNPAPTQMEASSHVRSTT